MSVNQGRVMDVHEIVNKLQNQATGTRNGSVPSGNIDIEQNGVYDVTDYAQATVQVPNTYAAGDEGKVVSGGALVSQTSRTVTENDTYDTTLNNSLTVQVPNTYTAGDEGKVVSNGALVSQSGRTVTENGVYDTTENNSVIVNVPAGSTGWTTDGIASGAEPTGAITISNAVSSIRERAFVNCTGITALTIQGSPYIGNNAFAGCRGITNISAPNLTRIYLSNYSISNNTFENCTGLTSIAFPSFANYGLPNYGFKNCTNLTTADCGGANGLQAAFNGCTALRTLVLRKSDGVVTCPGWSAAFLAGIYNNPEESKIYVPQSLISSYQSASGWSDAYAAGVTFEAIEGSIYE